MSCRVQRRAWRVLCVCLFGWMLGAPAIAFEPDVGDFDEDGDTLESMSEATAYGMHEKATDRINAAREVSPLAVDEAFGDRISLFHGTVTFDNVDIAVPGNSALPVELRRTLAVRDRRMANDTLGGFGDWDVDVPHLSGTFLKIYGWKVGAGNSVQRCDHAAKAPKGTALFLPDDFWDGYVLHVPGQGDQQLLSNPNAALPSPTDGNTHPWITKAMWRIRCKPTTANGHAGQAFIATSPDGIRYHLDHVIQRDAPGIGAGWTNGPGSVEERVRIYFAVTRVEDRHGNTVDYTWDGNGLQSISGSDGAGNAKRQITLTRSAGRITAATSSIGNWSYGYTGDGKLQTVTRPDAGTWTYQHGGGMGIATSYFPPIEDPSTPCMSTLENASTNYDLTVTHPAGGKAKFDFEAIVHGRSNVPNTCVAPGDGTYRYWQIPHDSLAMSLASKTVSGVGLPTMAWTYDYNVAAGPAVACENAPLCQGTTSHVVTGPDDTWARHTFGIRYGIDEGKLLKEEIGTGPGDIQRSTTHSFLTTAQVAAQPFPGDAGVHPMLHSDPQDRRLRPHRQTQITQQGQTFTRTADTYDVFARPLQVTRSSNVAGSTPRTEVTAYFDHGDSWTLGQVAKVTVGTHVPVETSYDAATALPETFQRFGKVYQTLGHDSAGNVTSVTDGNGNTITLDSWYRGIPRTVTFADATTQSAAVNAAGWITGVTDPMGYTTTYGHDAMGRVNLVTHPAGDSVGWASTSQAFQRVPASNDADSAAYANHWRQTVSTGNARRITLYDGLWRPLLTREYDLANVADTRRVQRFAHDHAGRTTFASYPAATDATAVSGTRTTYDALGRPTAVRQDSEHGELLTTTAYLASFRTLVTPPTGVQTTTSYVAWDTPTFDWPRQIATAPDAETPASTTTIARDPFGKPTSLTRSGTYETIALSHVRRYVYDAHQRLCKTIEPESGATVLAYDAADNLAWRATGLALPSTSDCNNASTAAGTGVPLAQRSVYSHDTRNRLLGIDHPAGTADVGFTYYADGALQTASAGATPVFPASTWTYAYNRRRLLTSESLDHAGRTFAITHAYDANGHRSSLTTPGGLVTAYAPDALGQPTTAGSFATTIRHAPTGRIASIGYGNGATRTVAPNARGWPAHILDTKGSNKLLDHTLTYDAQGNLDSLVDGSGGLESRLFDYDGLDRLIGVTPIGTATAAESYGYDPLDNVRRVVRGSVDRRHHYTAQNRLDSLRTPTGDVLIGYTWTARGELATRSNTTVPPPIPPGHVFGDGFETGFAPTQESFTFDAAGRLVAYNGSSERYAYDAHGHRLQALRPSPAGARLHLYTRAGQLVYEEDTWTGTATDYVHVDGQLIGKRTRPIGGGAATFTTLHTDHRGTPAAESNAAGTLVRRQRLGPYGLPDDGQYRDGPGFTGHVTDELARMSYMQQRYYDFEAMRFISMDPLAATPGSFNRYRYAANNPYRFIDPDGRAEKVTGSNIPGNSVAIARLATTAAVPQVVHTAMVQHGGPPIDESLASKQTQRVVDDANKAGTVMQISGDARGIAAFNKVNKIQIDSSSWTEGSMHGFRFKDHTVAYVSYGAGRVTLNAERYFSRPTHGRVSVLMHEVMHFDPAYENARLIQLNEGCASRGAWSCRYESEVEAHKNKIMRHYLQAPGE